MSRATVTAVVVAVAAAEPVVAAHRARLDRAAGWGVPAHVTVVYPFVHPARVDPALVDRLRAVVRSVAAFECTFARTRWFEEDVVWLAPEPDDGFRALTEAVWEAFPDHPPYGGAFEEVTPHLTVGQIECGTLEDLRRAEAAVVPMLPFRAHVAEARLLQGSPEPGAWSTVAVLPLG